MRERSPGDVSEAGDAASALAVPLSLAAFSATVDQRQAALFAFLHGLLGDAEQARDLTQDTFHDAWRATQAISPPWTLAHDDDERRRWLFHTAYCRAISQLRRRKVIRWASLDWHGPAERGADDADAATSAIPASLAEGGAAFEERIVEGAALRAALSRLHPDDVACLLLRVAHGFSTAEAAEAMRTTTEAVAQRLSRARRRLRAVYLEQNPPEGASDGAHSGAHGERGDGDE
jgi:RNA polymerase sigma-70 factor (ECF subfamily)